MIIYNVPNILVNEVENINFIYYENEAPNEKNKVLFSQNVITFLIEGEKEIFLAESKVKFQNSIALIRASHCLMSERKTNHNTPYKALLLFFNDSFLSNFKIKYKDELKTNILKEPPQEVNIIANDKYLTIFRKSIVETLSLNTNVLTQKMKALKLEELLLYLMNHYPKELHSFLKPQISEQSTLFKSIIEHNQLNNLCIDELAFLCNMSTSTFKRHFKKHYNTTPQKWFLKQRMNYANELTKQGKKPSEIYKIVGYTSLSNFIKAYKNQFGHTPKLTL